MAFQPLLGHLKQTKFETLTIWDCWAALRSPPPGWGTAAGSGGCQTRPAGPPGGSCIRQHEQQHHNLRRIREKVSGLGPGDRASSTWRNNQFSGIYGSTLCCLCAPGLTEGFPHLTPGCLDTRLTQEIITVSWQLFVHKRSTEHWTPSDASGSSADRERLTMTHSTGGVMKGTASCRLQTVAVFPLQFFCTK